MGLPIFSQFFGKIIVVASLWTGAGCQISNESPNPGPVILAEKGKPTKIESEPPQSESPYFQNNDPDDPAEYVIRPGDEIEVVISEEPDLKTTQTVDSSGHINLQFVKRVKIGELTVKKSEDLIAFKYKEDYLIEPSATVSVIKKAKRRFVILGQVSSPGFYEIPRSLKVDILQAIAIAGGYTRIAGTVLIKRTTSDGELKKKFNLRKLRKMPLHKIPIVAEDDTIIVGESLF
jgi:protein involved in polysaccharide export with SLBB domain